MKQERVREEIGNRWARVWILTATITISAVAQCTAATLYVSPGSAHPVPPYATPATAANNIQDAVNVANNGDTVLVEPGVYDLSNQVTIAKAITLRSTMGAGQTLLRVEFTDWGLFVSNSAAVVDGFSMNSGLIPPGPIVGAGGIIAVGATVQNCNFTNFFPVTAGSAATIIGGTISNCIVKYMRNPLFWILPAAAIYCDNGLVTDCQVLGQGGSSSGIATGVYLIGSQMRNTVVTGLRGNPEKATGSTVYGLNSIITDCSISGGFNMDSGGGAYLDSCLMDRCVVANNISALAGAGEGGGGIYETNSVVRDTLITGNTSGGGTADSNPGFGGGVWMDGGALVNCTIASNTVFSCFDDFLTNVAEGGGVYIVSGHLTNCIIFGNGTYACTNVENEWYVAGKAVFDDCCTTPNPGGVGNIVQDPQYVDPAAGNFHLKFTSPCIGAGVVQSWMTGAFDLDGNPRTSNGSVDMGAYQGLQPAQQITALIGMVNNLVQQGTLNHGRGNTLLVNLNAALGYLNSGKTSAACDQVAKFIGRVQALVDHGNLTPAQGQPLIDIANQLALALGC